MKDLFVCISCGLSGLLIGIMLALPLGIRSFVENLEAQEVYHIEDGRDDVYVDFRLGPFSYRKPLAKPAPKRNADMVGVKVAEGSDARRTRPAWK